MFRFLLVVLLAAGQLHGMAWADDRRRAKTVLDYSSELELNGGQQDKIRQSLVLLRQQLTECKKRSVVLQTELNELLRATAPLPKVRLKFEQIAANEVEAKMSDVTTARSIQAVLTPEQFNAWKALQTKLTSKTQIPP